MFQNETVQMYLNRIDVESGLLFNAVVMFDMLAPDMGKVHDRAERSSCAVNVCLGSFDTQSTCKMSWNELFHTTSGVQEPMLSRMVEMAADFCPHGAVGKASVAWHGSDSVA